MFAGRSTLFVLTLLLLGCTSPEPEDSTSSADTQQHTVSDSTSQSDVRTDDFDLGSPDPDPSTMTNYYLSRPHLIGGLSGLQQSIQYPKFAQERRIEGRVFVELVVDADGQPSRPRLAYGIHKLLNEEALRVVRQTDWVPAKQDGEPVRMTVTVPVNFWLDSTAAK